MRSEHECSSSTQVEKNKSECSSDMNASLVTSDLNDINKLFVSLWWKQQSKIKLCHQIQDKRLACQGIVSSNQLSRFLKNCSAAIFSALKRVNLSKSHGTRRWSSCGSKNYHQTRPNVLECKFKMSRAWNSKPNTCLKDPKSTNYDFNLRQLAFRMKDRHPSI